MKDFISKKTFLILLAIISGLLLSLGWPERGFPGLLFIGFVPLLFLEEILTRNRDRDIKFSVLLCSWPGFFVWNILTTWWIVNSTLIGAALAIILNSLFMSIIFQTYHWSRKKLQHPLAGYAALISYWIAFEYLHLNWDLNWPWLNLGNGFASYYKWVQWYEFTGTFGGTIWILVGNILVFELLKKLKTQNSKFLVQYSIFIVIWIFAPLIFSYVTYSNYREKKDPVTFVVVQPNLDPYSEQYTLAPSAVVGRILKVATPYLDKNTNFLIAPESAIQENMWENDLSSFSSIQHLHNLLFQYPDLNILVGGSTFYQLLPGEPLPRSARKFSDTDHFYIAYNTAIMINIRDSLQLYHKSKLTPGVEILPSFKGFKWLENYAIDLGGTVGSLGTDSIRKVYNTVNTVKVGPVICYESIFGEFFARFVQNGAQLMIIITNDGWWGNTAGHRQHFSFAHLRAIETRRCIARSANTGISAFINQRGDASGVTEYWKPAVIKSTLNANQKITFYVKHGDYLARIFSWLGGALLMVTLVLSFQRRFKKTGHE
ncbi:MAG: apolipoprotein N-acyltransferase [Bacteroidales bacterium]|jgi:apolipoprotein N-acyltransferase|nr:apolipoprotein N-acyltransferase [Bacteroidales bacterium]